MTEAQTDEAPIYGVAAQRLDGAEDHLGKYRGRVLLVVNVASLCGRTPQYAGLQELHSRYESRGFSVLGFPCNQFGDEEPGSAAEIAEFCETMYGVTFPMFAKVDVNGPNRHPLYSLLTATPYDDAPPADVRWNFEKFLIDRGGRVARRFHYTIVPTDSIVVDAIEATL